MYVSACMFLWLNCKFLCEISILGLVLIHVVYLSLLLDPFGCLFFWIIP